MRKLLLCSAMMGMVVAGSSAQAVEFDGFLTAGFAIHDQDDSAGGATYLNGITDDISFDNDSKFGLQITADVAENMQAVAQILAAGSDENYDMDVEWAYLDYRLSDTVSLRGGKVKEPVFLISDYFEVGYAYPWIRPPQEVYTNNPINTINGLEALIQFNVAGANVSFQPYLGSNNEDIPGSGGLATFSAENFIGMSFLVNTDAFTFQLSHLQTDVVTVAASPPLPAFFNSVGEAELTSFGVSWDIRNFVGYTEYVTRDISGTTEAVFPDQDAWYITLGYRQGKFLPHLTIANSESDPLAAFNGVNQDSITLGLRYELNDSAALKAEYQQVEPEAGQTGLFSGALTDDKVNVISVAIDVIF